MTKEIDIIMSNRKFEPKPDFDPDNPVCPKCNAKLTSDTLFESIRYDEIPASMHIHICAVCNAATGVVVLDKLAPDDYYVVHEITAKGDDHD
jgi:hypothetical protein